MQRLTPRDIFNKDFKSSIRGYDVDEVNEFLDLVIQNYEAVLEENQELKEELKKVKAQRLPRRQEGDQDRVVQDILRRLERLEQMMMR
ncbi:DivIVA domain-containing protein [Kroppenstedtia eburnea]|uniref:DivIVA domain-containing protein n=1 Tax=Kroppenstedtia eburnea TaxID=714067 RepID=A0A1N7PSR1_9BACL|nr:DivIVA domain-containing protein [Kroppenstedtia eburnea]EGK12795.1 septum site-determining protein divIVA [Desmospora sp. 8437]QKI82673.1 DivIVA domain-containing protein [Kroppenstedtia eburnea]SIT13616.1 DivIVA domain-containing protein [Kroppenstedtia eburnea]